MWRKLPRWQSTKTLALRFLTIEYYIKNSDDINLSHTIKYFFLLLFDIKRKWFNCLGAKNFTHHWRVTCGKFFCKRLWSVEQYSTGTTRCGIWTRKWGLKYASENDNVKTPSCWKTTLGTIFWGLTASLSCYNLKGHLC